MDLPTSFPHAVDLESEGQALERVFEKWSRGSHEAAIEHLEVALNLGARWALVIHPWLSMQLGQYSAAVRTARVAADFGMPWVIRSSMVTLMSNHGALEGGIDEVADLVEAYGATHSFDVIGPCWQMIGQGSAGAIIRIIENYAEPSMGSSKSVAEATTSVNEIRRIRARARKEVARVDDRVQEVNAELDQLVENFRTRTNQAGLMVDSTVLEASNSLYKRDASKNSAQSFRAWTLGVLFLIIAACVAAAPLFRHYRNIGPDLSALGLAGAHGALTIALASVAGVFLTRARTRDRAAQRSSDLSTAMGTMITYANQIENVDDRQRFILATGHLILQANVSPSVGSVEESASGPKL